VTLVSGAYLADLVARGRPRRPNWRADGAIVLVTAAILVSMRPLMGIYAVTAGAIVIVLLIRRGGVRWPAWMSIAAVLVALGVIQGWRDRTLSGWLLYPLSLLSFDVPWRAPAAVDERTATLWAARDPLLQESWQEASGWSWVTPWAGRLTHQWETYLFAALFVITLVLVLAARKHMGSLRVMFLTMAPAAVTVAVWFLATPPAFRFAWGPLLLLGAVPAGFSLAALRRSTAVRVAAVGMATVALLSGSIVSVLHQTTLRSALSALPPEIRSWSLGPVHVDYEVSPLLRSDLRTITVPGGVEILYPVGTDQCWRAYPLCTGQVPGSLRWRTPLVIQDGFTR